MKQYAVSLSFNTVALLYRKATAVFTLSAANNDDALNAVSGLVKSATVESVTEQAKPKKVRAPKSRPERWAAACSQRVMRTKRCTPVNSHGKMPCPNSMS